MVENGRYEVISHEKGKILGVKYLRVKIRLFDVTSAQELEQAVRRIADSYRPYPDEFTLWAYLPGMDTTNAAKATLTVENNETKYVII